MIQEETSTEQDSGEIPDVSAREQVGLVLDDVRELVAAELEYYRSRLDYSRHVVRHSSRWAIVSALSLTATAIALVMGLVMTLSPYVGPLAATLIVTFIFGGIGAYSGLKARNWMKRIYFPEIDKDDDDAA